MHCGKVLRIAFVAWATHGALIKSNGDRSLLRSLEAATRMPNCCAIVTRRAVAVPVEAAFKVVEN